MEPFEDGRKGVVVSFCLFLIDTLECFIFLPYWGIEPGVGPMIISYEESYLVHTLPINSQLKLDRHCGTS